MKKLVAFAFLIALLSSCEVPTTPPLEGNYYYEPVSYIYGTWGGVSGAHTFQYTFNSDGTFSNHDVLDSWAMYYEVTMTGTWSMTPEWVLTLHYDTFTDTYKYICNYYPMGAEGTFVEFLALPPDEGSMVLKKQ